MIKVDQRGDFEKTLTFLKKVSTPARIEHILNKYGKLGVERLKESTPRNTGETADSWGYRINRSKSRSAPFGGEYNIEWYNTNINDGVPISIILQYGHGTGTGGFVYGRDYINTALEPVMDQFTEEIWREVISL